MNPFVLDRTFPWPSPIARPLPERLTVKSEGSLIFIPIPEIVWVEAQGDYVRFHAGRSSCLARTTMKSVTETLPPEKFLRVHRSTVVNVDAIAKIAVTSGEAVVLRDGTRLRIGGGYRAQLRAFYLERLHPPRRLGPTLRIETVPTAEPARAKSESELADVPRS
ncbi:MAG: two component transcriptional regulator, LytTR family [Verrucomicrobia bacterium]|nr:two component transcriptional regulator, LytTR family [Verrucomicrobiota bacterium]